MNIRSFPRPPREDWETDSRDDAVESAQLADIDRQGLRRRKRRYGNPKDIDLSRIRLAMIGVVAFAALVGLVIYGVRRERKPGGEHTYNVALNLEIADNAPRKTTLQGPSGQECEAIVKKVLSMEKADQFRDFVRLKDISEQEAVAILAELRAKAGQPNRVEWLTSGSVNHLQVARVRVVFENERFERIALLTPDASGNWQMDLAAFAGKHSVDWDTFLKEADREGVLRVAVSRDRYYNEAFSDEKTWSCYRLSALNELESLVGYCRRGSQLDKVLGRLLSNPYGSRAVLRVKKSGTSLTQQCEILAILAEDWILTDAPFDGTPSKPPSE